MTSVFAERVREVLSYDAETGIFTWRVRTAHRVHVGDMAGSLNTDGYRRIKIDGRLYKAHRLAWIYVYGAWPNDQIDHINSERDDNRIANLRDVTGSVNQQNQQRARSNNKSCGLLGVTADGNRWKAQIKLDGKKSHLGTFATPELAHAAYLVAKRSVHAGCTI